MALKKTYFAFSANTEGQGWGDMNSRCAVLFHLWSGLATWCDKDQKTEETGLGLLTFPYKLNDNHAYTANTEIATYAAFESPGIGESTELNHENGWLNRCQYVPTKASIKKWNDMLKESGEEGFVSGLTIQRLSNEHSGVTSLGLKIYGEDNYTDNQAVKWWDLYFEMQYDDQPIHTLNQIRVSITNVPDIPASGGEITEDDITYVVEAEYTDNPGTWVVVTPNTVSPVSVTANTLSATVTTARTLIDRFNLTVGYGGKSATSSNNAVYQAINKLTTTSRTRQRAESSTETENERYEISIDPTTRTVKYNDTSITISVNGTYEYDNVESVWTEYDEAIDSAYTSNVQIDGEFEYVSASTKTVTRTPESTPATVEYEENVDWITGVTITEDSSTIEFEQNGFTVRDGVVRYLIEDDNSVYADFTLRQNPQGSVITAITITCNPNRLTIPAGGGSVTKGNVTYIVTGYYNNGTSAVITDLSGVDVSSNTVSMPSRGSNVGEEIPCEDLVLTATYGTYTDSCSVDVYQEANVCTVTTTTGKADEDSIRKEEYSTTKYSIEFNPSSINVNSDDGSTTVEVIAKKNRSGEIYEYDTWYETSTPHSAYTSGAESVGPTTTGTTQITGETGTYVRDFEYTEDTGTTVWDSPDWCTATPTTSSNQNSTINYSSNSGNERSGEITYAIKNAFYERSSITITQAAGSVYLEYITVEVSSVEDIPAAGGSVDWSDATYTVTAHYSNGTTGDVTSVSIMSSNTVSAESKGTTVRPRNDVGDLTITANYLELTDEGTIDVFQEKNKVEENDVLTERTNEQTSTTYDYGTSVYDITVTPSSANVDSEAGYVSVAVAGTKTTPRSATTTTSWDVESTPWSAYTSTASGYGETTTTHDSTATTNSDSTTESADVELDGYEVNIITAATTSEIYYNQNDSYSQRAAWVRYRVVESPYDTATFTLRQNGKTGPTSRDVTFTVNDNIIENDSNNGPNGRLNITTMTFNCSTNDGDNGWGASSTWYGEFPFATNIQYPFGSSWSDTMPNTFVITIPYGVSAVTFTIELVIIKGVDENNTPYDGADYRDTVTVDLTDEQTTAVLNLPPIVWKNEPQQ